MEGLAGFASFFRRGGGAELAEGAGFEEAESAAADDVPSEPSPDAFESTSICSTHKTQVSTMLSIVTNS